MDEIVAFERRLRRAARVRSEEAAGTELAAILQRVAERRARRSRPLVRDGGSGSGGETRAETATDSWVEVSTIERVASTVRILRTGRPSGLQFRAGQHVKLGEPGGRSGTFSIASAPHDPYLEFCIELIPGGRLTPALFALAPGARVTVATQPKGAFELDASAACHLMVATVTGIAPLRSMLRDALHQGTTADFIVLHGASHADELPYLDELTALATSNERVQYRPTVSRPSAARNLRWQRDIGRVDEIACSVAATLDPRAARVYACGHSAMVERVVSELGSTGFEVATETFD